MAEAAVRSKAVVLFLLIYCLLLLPLFAWVLRLVLVLFDSILPVTAGAKVKVMTRF